MAMAQPRPSPEPSLTGTSIGRFTICELLGAGGMGEVYRAEDTTLKRTVALKRVSPRLREDPRARRRVLKEAERASALNSPHIAAVYDVLEDRDDVFLVMEYVEGGTLRQQMQGPLDLQRFLDIATQCAEALASAHRKHIVHGDIKPENIMITADGTAKVLDFGLARRMAGDSSAPLESTQTAMLAGTPGYIAPEVLLAKDPDARSDIFSLGVVFYEALTRRHPFSGKTFTEAADKTLHHTPAALSLVVPSVPPELERIVGKMLAKDPAERYATSADLLVDLRRLRHGETQTGLLLPSGRLRHWAWHALRVLAAVLVFLVLVSVMPDLRQQWRRWRAGPDLPQKKNLAVLSFQPVSPEPSARAFAQGLTETLAAKLTEISSRYGVQVVSPTEMRSVKSVDEARAAFGATLVLEGSLHQADDRVRVVYRLVDAKSRQQLRADTVTADMADAFAVEDRVVESVLRSLDVELEAQEREAIGTHGTTRAAAYELYLRGRGYLQDYTNPANVESAVAAFSQAIQSDPNYALAYAGLGESYWHKYDLTGDSAWVENAQKACEQAGTLGAGHICLGTVFNGTGQYEKAAAQFEQALKLDANSDDAYRGLGLAYEKLGRIADAEQVYRRAIAMRPPYGAGYTGLGTVLFRQARYGEAAEMFKQVTVVAPDNVRGYTNLGGLYIVAGQYADAIPALEHAISIRPSGDAYSNLATAFFYQRKFGDAASNYEQALRLDPENYVAAGDLGDAYYWGGKRAEAAAAYRQAIKGGERALKVNPRDAHLLGRLAVYHAMIGEDAQARNYVARALAVAPGSDDVRMKAAIVHLQAGRRDASLQWLGKGIAAGLPPSQITNNPIFDQLSKDPQFQSLLRNHPQRQER